MNQRTVDIVKELAGSVCRCGKPKQCRQTFCKSCYRRLPTSQQRDLYKLLSEGYVDAYDAACLTLGFEVAPHV